MKPWTPRQIDAVAQHLLRTANQPNLMPWEQQFETSRELYRDRARRIEQLVRDAG